MSKIKSLIKSRRFILAVSAVAVVLCTDLLQISQDKAELLIGIAATWILGDSISKTL